MIELTNINSKMNLNNGTQIPCVGYGTFRTPADVAEKAVADAIKVGYRHIDTKLLVRELRILELTGKTFL